MIVTLTVNPSLDHTIEIDALVRGAVHRARSARVDPGGKGVNVSRVLAANGHKTRAVLPSGPEGGLLFSLLAAAGIEFVRIPIAGAVRTNVAVAEPDGTITKFNEAGPTLAAAEADAVVAATIEAAERASWVVLSGSLPPGVPADFYGTLVSRLHQTDVRVAVDTSGPALAAALAAAPDLVKPNREELAEAAGRPLRTLGDVVDAAGELIRRGPRTVLASLGSDGAVVVGSGPARHGESRVDAPRSTVGAGDSMLAGFLSAWAGPGDTDARALREGLAWGAAATGLPGSRLPEPDDIDRSSVTVHPEVARDRLLSRKD